MHAVSAVVDVRSSPYSRYNPQFNREPLRAALRDAEIEYVYLGKELGARTPVRECYVEGKVRFDRLAKTPLFRFGLQRLSKGLEEFNACLLCAEKDPLLCHRTILVCRNVRSPELRIQHILEDGSLEDNADAEQRLLRLHHIESNDLFMSDEELVEKAYDLQGEKIAYGENDAT